MINKEIRLFFKYNNDYLNVNYNDIIKIPYFFQLLEDRTYDEYKELEVDKIDINNFKLILDFIKIENQSIKDYIKEIEQVSYYTTSIMPSSLNNYLSIFDIKNEKKHDTMIINKMINFKEDCNYLQYDLLGDVIEYKWADNYRIMDRCLLKEILTENVHDVCNDLYKETDEIFINDFDCKFQPIILHHYQIDEDIIDDVLKQKIENPLKGVSLNQFKFKEILMSNVNELLEELNYLT